MTTQKDDAASIVGEELAEELEELKQGETVKSQAIVVKSEGEEDQPQEIFEELRASISELASQVTEIRSQIVPVEAVLEETPIHPLDEAVNAMKSRFDEVVEAEGSSEEKLAAMQEVFTNIGEAIKSLIVNPASSEDQADEEPLSGESRNLVAALSEVMQPLSQKLDMVITQLSEQRVSVSQVPQRRSYQPPPTYVPPEIAPRASVQESETPKLRALVNKSVGL